jgi:hypothetical protein
MPEASDGACHCDQRSGAPCGDRRRVLLAELRARPTCSVERAAEIIGVARSTAYAAARDGSLPTLRISHRLLVQSEKLIALLGLEGEE